MLYADRESIYRIGYNRKGPGAADGLSVGWDDRGLANIDAWRRSAIPAEVVGIVDSCERRMQRVIDAGGIPFLGGYCHYHGGPVIVPSTANLHGQPLERMRGEALRERLGDLIPMPDDWRDRPEVEKIAGALAAAAGAGNAAEVAGLLGAEPADPRVGALLLQGPGHSPTSRPALFISRYAPDQGLRSPHGYDALGCICRGEDCADLWPLARIDADAAPERPYACFKIERGDWRGARAEVTAGTRSWLREPGTKKPRQ